MQDFRDIILPYLKNIGYVLFFVAVFFGIFLLFRKFIFRAGDASKKNAKVKYSRAELDEKARSYGAEGSKQLMKDSIKKRQTVSIILLAVGVCTVIILPPVGLGCLVAYVLVNDKLRKQEQATGRDSATLYRVNFLEPALEKVFPEGYEYEKAACLRDQSVLAALPDMKGTPYDKFIWGKDRVRFTHKGLPISFSYNTCDVESGTDDEGHPTYRQVFCGQIYEANYKTRIEGYVRIVPTIRHLGRESVGDYLKQIPGKEVKVETDHIYFNEHFDVFATSQQDALFVLNPVVINFFVDYAQQSQKKQAMFVSGDAFVIARDGLHYDVFDAPLNLNQIDALSVEEKVQAFSQIGDSCLEMLGAINGSSAV